MPLPRIISCVASIRVLRRDAQLPQWFGILLSYGIAKAPYRGLTLYPFGWPSNANNELKTSKKAAQRVLLVSLMAGATLVVLGCASWLPKSRTESPTFHTFDEARQAIESLVPHKSNMETLTALGLTPTKQPNTMIMTQADVVRRVVSGVMGKEDLDPGIVTCINAHEACRGWEFNVANIDKTRTGNFWADFLNFKRHTETTGWRFNALILLVNPWSTRSRSIPTPWDRCRTWGHRRLPGTDRSETHDPGLVTIQSASAPFAAPLAVTRSIGFHKPRQLFSSVIHQYQLIALQAGLARRFQGFEEHVFLRSGHAQARTSG